MFAGGCPVQHNSSENKQAAAMSAHIIRRMILALMLASLPCVVTAAGSLAGESAQPTGTEQAAPYDCGSAYYAPGSYSSWFYVSPPSWDEESPATEVAMPPTALNLPSYYDFEPRWGPLFS
jgi:hypothetical protein